MAHAKTTTTPPEATPPINSPPFNKTKLSFLYILIGGIAVSALISIYAILIGEFSGVVQKALWTTFILVTHSILVLTLVSSDTKNHIGHSLIPTVILGTLLANTLTATIGLWGVWDAELSWRAAGLYTLFIGASFIVAGLLKLRVAHPPTLAMVYTTLGLTVLWMLLLVPWVFIDTQLLGAFYFRLVGAVTILASTVFVILCITRAIAVSQRQALLTTKPAPALFSGGMLAIIITIGTIVSLVWLISFFVFIIVAMSAA